MSELPGVPFSPAKSYLPPKKARSLANNDLGSDVEVDDHCDGGVPLLSLLHIAGLAVAGVPASSAEVCEGRATSLERAGISSCRSS
eukprot:scaffold135924_cov31-Tisochrysis_lutea.AAC.1